MYFFALDFGQKIGHLRSYFLFLAPACSLHLILRGKSESADVKTFLSGMAIASQSKSNVFFSKISHPRIASIHIKKSHQ